MFAPDDGALSGGLRRLNQVAESRDMSPHDWGVYMVADYLDFDGLLDRAMLPDSNLATLSEGGEF